MKKTFCFLTVGLLCLSLFACGGSESSSAESSEQSTQQQSESSAESASSSYPVYDEPSISFHYRRNDGDYTNWALWIWRKGGEGAQFAFNGYDSFGAVAAYPLSDWGATVVSDGLGFIVKSGPSGTWTSKDPDGDRFLDFSLFKKDAKDVYNIYLFTQDSGVYDSPDKTMADTISASYFLTKKVVKILSTNPIRSYTLYQDGASLVATDLATVSSNVQIVLPDGVEGDPMKAYSVDATFAYSGVTLTRNVQSYVLYKNPDFGDSYTYTGDDLGAVYSQEKTVFKVWSPISTSLTLRLYETGTPLSIDRKRGSDSYVEYPMSRIENGVWTYDFEGDAAGKYYTYFVKNRVYPNGKEAVDPYAKSAGINGLRGMIVDFSKTNPLGWDSFDKALDYDRKSLCVDEMHIADLTSDASWGGTATNAKKFSGFFETGTTYQEGQTTVKTGFDHIKELGVNAVQLLPIFDQANDEKNPTFNWGYNPLNYNCLDGVYSSDPYDGYARIKEFKELVAAYHSAGINIIMDVVYNHTSGAEGSNFDILCPGYYYRYDATGSLYNGSGCGNVTASEMPMMRKFMIDSALFWEKEYKLGGFRFDLMGCHDLETMKQLAAACLEVNPTFCIYGEPWTGGTTGLLGTDQADQSNGSKWVGYGGFNDQMRDALIAGGLSTPTDKGWAANTASAVAAGTLSKIIKGVSGITNSMIKDPDKTVNYVTCHDNYTLFDRFYYGNGITDETLVTKMAFLSEAAAILSQGTSFFQGGEEFLRSKGGNSNSYNADYSVNAMKYSLAIKNQSYLENFKKLIALKTRFSFFSKTQSAIESDMSASFNAGSNTLTYQIQDGGMAVKVALANGLATAGGADFTGFDKYLDNLGRETSALAGGLMPFEVAVGVSGIME